MKKTSNQYLSRTIESGQNGLHQGLTALVSKHLQHPFRKPYASHNVAAFTEAARWLGNSNLPLILDSFCGVGESTRRLAAAFPRHRVIGIDKSAHRLSKHRADPAALQNYLLVRANVDDFWRLALDAGWQPERHYLLYPNPWPKPGQLRYRVHGSPAFPALLALGGTLELRSNWEIYVREFHQALALAGRNAAVESFAASEPLTPFERKYAASGQTLWRCQSPAA